MNAKTRQEIIEMFAGRSGEECELIVRNILMAESIKTQVDQLSTVVDYDYSNGHAMKVVPSKGELEEDYLILHKINEMLNHRLTGG